MRWAYTLNNAANSPKLLKRLPMRYKCKGVINAINEVKTTTNGYAVRQIDFKQDQGDTIYPSFLGEKIALLNGYDIHEYIEIDFHLSGKKGMYNNVIVDNIRRC